MAMSEYRKMEIEQRKLNRDLDKIAKKEQKKFIINKELHHIACIHHPRYLKNFLKEVILSLMKKI